MSSKPKGLGRGLGALIPTDVPTATQPVKVVASSVSKPETGSPVVGAHLAEVDINAITPNPKQPRQIFDEAALAELVHSIRELGILQPPVVRQTPQGFELVAGERRLRAAKGAGLRTIPVIVRDTNDDAMLRDALLENLHRSDLNPLEEAAAYDQMLKDFGCTHEELAERIGRSRPQISNTIRLLKLPTAVARRVAAGVLSAGHARALLALTDEGEMERIATKIVAEGLSVRAVEELIALGVEPEKKARAKSLKVLAPELKEMATRIGDRLDTRVSIEMGKKKGKITIEFASVEDLGRIIDQIERE